MTRRHKQKSPALARAFFSGLVGAAGLVTTIGIAQPARADTLADYLVQQVCDDGNGGHTSADPTTCPAAARKLRIGEALPYHKWDTASGAGQISDSYPVAELQGRTRVVHTFFFNDTNNFQNPEFDLADPVTGRTGYDLSMTDGSYVSFAGTYDPGAGWQPLWRNSACSLSDSWVIGPKAQTLPLTYGDTTTSLNNRSPQCPPSSAYGSSYTGWNYYPDYLYESGKRLNTVKSWHFNSPSINADGIEQFYFTKEYGKTRWEAWSSNVSAPSANAVARCPTGVDNGVAVFGSTTYYLTDCHDWSFVKPAPNGDWSPDVNWHVDPLYTSVNLLKNTHMQCTDSAGQAGECGVARTCRTIEPWKRLGDLNWTFNPNLQAPNASANCALRFAIPSVPSGQSVYQDITTLPTGRNTFTFGAGIWSRSGVALSATLRVYELNSSGVVAQHDVPVSADGRRRIFKSEFSKNPATTWMRFEVYPSTSNADYEMTEAWIAPKP